MKKQDFLKKHKVRSKLEEEKVRKKLVDDEIYKIDQMGQESEKKAAKVVKEVAEEEDKKEKEFQAKQLEILHKVKKKDKEYKKRLLFYLHSMIEEIDWPKEYEWGIWFDGKGVRLAVKDKNKVLHQRAFQVTNDPKYDLHACLRFAVWAEDVLDLIEDRMDRMHQQGGVWLPNGNALSRLRN